MQDPGDRMESLALAARFRTGDALAPGQVLDESRR
jgi:hypothetical protein